jgi:hypothetical protein
VPDQGFTLSANRTPHPLSVKFATVIAGAALALGAAAAAAASAAPAGSAADHPTTGHLTTGHLTTGHLTTGHLTTGHLVTGRTTRTHAQPSVKLATLLTPAAAAATTALTPRQIARQMLPSFGWSQRQFPYLNWLWNRESGWNKFAENPYSGAYGIPQALPGAKMASAGPNWPSNARTQIRWGLRYIRATYGSPRRAWDHEVAYGWY